MNIDNIVNNIITKEKITNEEINLLSNLDYSEQSYIRNLIISKNYTIKIPSYALWRAEDICNEKNKLLWYKTLFDK